MGKKKKEKDTTIEVLSMQKCEEYFGDSDFIRTAKDGESGIFDWRRVVEQYPFTIATYPDDEGKGLWIEVRTSAGRYSGRQLLTHERIAKWGDKDRVIEHDKEVICNWLLRRIARENIDEFAVKMGVNGWQLIWKGEGTEMAQKWCIWEECQEKAVYGIVVNYFARDKRYIPLWCVDHAPHTVEAKVFEDSSLGDIVWRETKYHDFLNRLAQYFLGKAYSVEIEEIGFGHGEILSLMREDESVANSHLYPSEGKSTFRAEVTCTLNLIQEHKKKLSEY